MDTNEQWYKQVNKIKGKRLTRASAIKNYCKLECCAGDLESWKNCDISNCFLYRFRLGKETLGKPQSFKKQRKKRAFSEKKEASSEDIIIKGEQKGEVQTESSPNASNGEQNEN